MGFVPKRKRIRESLKAVVSRLEAQVQHQHQRLQQQITENRKIRIQDDIVLALAACVRAIEPVFSPEAGASHLEEADLEELDRQCLAFLTKLEQDAQPAAAGTVGGGRATGGGGNGDQEWAAAVGDAEEEWPYGCIGISPAGYIRKLAEIVAVPCDRDTFVDTIYKPAMLEMAMLLNQTSTGEEGAHEELQKVVTDFICLSTGHLAKPWGPTCLPLNFETGEIGEPPQGQWRRVVTSADPSDTLLIINSTVNRWWKTTAAVLNSERQALAQEALTDPSDVELQDAMARELVLVNRAYQTYAISAGVIMSTTTSTAQGTAQTFVQAYPYFPVLTAILEANDQLASERAAAEVAAS